MLSLKALTSAQVAVELSDRLVEHASDRAGRERERVVLDSVANWRRRLPLLLKLQKEDLRLIHFPTDVVVTVDHYERRSDVTRREDGGHGTLTHWSGSGPRGMPNCSRM